MLRRLWGLEGWLVLVLVACGLASSSAEAGFSDPSDSPAGSAPRSVVAADFDGNGTSDLAVANRDSNDVLVLLGNGDGTFKNGIAIKVGSGPNAVASADLNADGSPDLAVTNSLSSNLSILLGKGNGAFTKLLPISLGTGPNSVESADLDSNGKPDLAVATDSGILILLGLGQGKFLAPTAVAAGTDFWDVRIGNLNPGGIPDLAAASSVSQQVSVIFGKKGGAFWTPVNIAAGNSPRSVEIADLDNDGDEDLAVGNYLSEDVSILLGDGDGKFGAPISVKVGKSPHDIVSADLNADQFPDLVTSNLNSHGISVLYGRGGGAFDAAVPYPADKNPFSLVVGRFDADFKPDVVTANFGSNNVSLLRNQWASVQILPSSLSFGSVPIDGAVKRMSVEISNLAGGDPVALSSAKVTGQSGPFEVTYDGCRWPLLLGGECSIEVTFDPNSAGQKSDSLSIVHDGLDSPGTVPMTGAGTSNPAVFDGKRLHIRLKCPARFKPRCVSRSMPVTKKSKRGKPMASRKVVKRIRSNKWVRVSYRIKPAFRKKVWAMTKIDKKLLFVRQQIRSKKIRSKKNHRVSTVFHIYKVRTKK